MKNFSDKSNIFTLSKFFNFLVKDKNFTVNYLKNYRVVKIDVKKKTRVFDTKRSYLYN